MTVLKSGRYVMIQSHLCSVVSSSTGNRAIRSVSDENDWRLSFRDDRPVKLEALDDISGVEDGDFAVAVSKRVSPHCLH